MKYMTICGMDVYHKRFGNGIISGLEDNRLTVTFRNSDGSEQMTKFIFPDAFTKNFLTSSDPHLEELIQKYVQEHSCVVCGRENTVTTDVDGKQLCHSCVEKYAKKCTKCGQVHLKESFSSANISEYPYYISMCKECFSCYVHKCDRCNTNFVADDSVHSYNGRIYCDRCYQNLITVCDICGEEYFDDDGKTVYKDGDYIDVCPKCLKEKTFVCSECDRHVFNESLVDSKYVLAERQICSSCVEFCNSCGEAVDTEHSCTYFGKTYCKDCEASKKVECPICSDEFIPDVEGQTICPDCVDATEYMELTQKLDFSSRQAKVMSVYSLDYMDRCELFTNLYENCRSLESGCESNNQDEPYHYLVMNLIGHNAIVTYLPRNITSKIKHSANVTMTELRTKKGRFKVHAAIEKWLSESDHTLSISEGTVYLLHYPVLIRAQTEYDKIYGKEWNGPDDYIEIGNYGDTTDFYIIGVLK